MEVRVLRYFLAVAREQSISGAAKYLHVTQPTLSRQLQDLEKELGKQLVVRGSRRVTLTPEGMLLKRRAAEIVDLVDRTEREVSSSDRNVTGTVTVGTGESEGVATLVRAAARLRESHPGIDFSFVGGTDSETVERIDSGVVDFGMLAATDGLSKLDSLRLPGSERWGVLVRDDSELAQSEEEGVCARSLRGKPLILAREQGWCPSLRSWFGKSCKGINVVATYDLALNAELMAREGLGAVVTSDKLLDGQIDTRGLSFVPFEPTLTTGVLLAWKKFRGMSRSSQLYLDAVRHEVARELAAAA